MPQPTTVTANYAVPGNTSSGGRLQGAGFGATAPQMNANDTLQVVVTVGGNSAQAPLSGYFIVSPKADGQTTPSPFMSSGKYLCYLSLAPTSQSGQQYTFSSSLLTIPAGTAAGSFELTLVIQDSTGAQWSEDPEFDTTGD